MIIKATPATLAEEHLGSLMVLWISLSAGFQPAGAAVDGDPGLHTPAGKSARRGPRFALG